MHRQTHNLTRGLLGFRQSAAMDRDAISIGRLQVDWDRIMDERPHAPFPQMLAQSVAFVAAGDVLMIDALDYDGAFRQSQRSRREPVIVNSRDLSSPRVLYIQIFQLHAQDGGLQFVEPRIEPRLIAHVSLAPSILAQQSNSLSDFRVVRHDRAPIAQRAEILRRIEAEGCGVPEDSDLKPVNRRAVSLRAILYDFQIVSARNVAYRPHVGRAPVKVNRQDRPDPPDPVDMWPVTKVSDRVFDRFGADRERRRIDIDQQRRGSGHLDGGDCSDSRVRYSDHQVAGPDAGRAQGQM